MSARKEKRTRLSWTRAAGSATAINCRSPRRAPHAGSAICTSATASARTSEKCPSSTIMGGGCSRNACADRWPEGRLGTRRRLGAGRPDHCGTATGRMRRPRRSASIALPDGRAAAGRARYICASLLHISLDFAGVFPNALRLQRLGHFWRHVVLVVLGKYDVGKEMPSTIELAFGHDALALAKEIRKDPGVADRDGLGLIGNGEFNLHAGTALEATLGHKAAQANALARRNGSFHHLPWREEEDDRVAQGDRDQEHRERKHGEGQDDKHGAALLAGHGWVPRGPAALACLVLSGEPGARPPRFPDRQGAEAGAGRGRRRFCQTVMSRGRGFWRVRRARPTPSRPWGSAGAPGQARRGRHPCG